MNYFRRSFAIIVVCMCIGIVFRFQTREVILYEQDTRWNGKIGYKIVDNNMVFFGAEVLGEKIMTGVDISHFSLLSTGSHYIYASDGNDIYFNNRIISGVDIQSFQLLTGVYSRDSHYLYVASIQRPEVDVDTFEDVGGFDFFKDKSTIYHGPSIFKPNIEGASGYKTDIKTFKELPCSGTYDNYDRPLNFYVDKYTLYDGDYSQVPGVPIDTGFDFDTLVCEEGLLKDKYGPYAVLFPYYNHKNLFVIKRDIPHL